MWDTLRPPPACVGVRMSLLVRKGRGLYTGGSEDPDGHGWQVITMDLLQVIE